MILSASLQNYVKKINVKKAFASITLMMRLALSLGPYAFSLKSTNAQPSDDMCEKLPVVKVGLDLGIKKVLCAFDIAWYRGDVRSYNFVVSVSNDGTNFKDIVSASSTGKITSAERYNIPDQIARYVRVTVHGNTHNDLGSITEMAVRGQGCTSTQISGVSATGDDGHVPQNTIDNNMNTRWSNYGVPSFIQYGLGKSQSICDVDIAWYRGNLRANIFIISASDDGQNFQPIFTGISGGKTTAAERYDVTDVKARYIKIMVLANTENIWTSISEVKK